MNDSAHDLFPSGNDPKWSQAKRIFEQAKSFDVAAREGYLRDACAEDLSLLVQVRELLENYDEAGSFMQASPAPAAPARTLANGTVLLDRFRIVDFVGSGGMGQVYRAEDLLSGGAVALKAIRPEIAADAQSSRRFRRELRLSRQVTHPNVCRMYELWSAPHDGVDLSFLTMELLEGETLAQRLHRKERIPPALALMIARHIAAGVAEVHRLGLVHRDLKPSNVFLVRGSAGDDTIERAVVMDFGLARTAQLSGAPDVTSAGALLGTPAYMAPELLEGKEASNCSDVYAFGVTLYEMLTGRNRIVVAPSKIIPGLRQSWETAIGKCLDSNPEKRPTPITEVIGIIERRPSFAWLKFAVAILALATVIAAIAYLLSHTTSDRSASHITRLTFDSGFIQDVSYSADGNTLTYSSDHGTDGNLSIWVQDSKTGKRRQLVRGNYNDAEPALSPDGKLVAFRSERDGGGVYLVSVSGGSPYLLASRGRHPRFSADGQSVAFWEGQPGDVSEARSRAYVIPVGGGERKRIAPQFADVRYPVWSPHGRRILFWGAISGYPSVEANLDWYVEDIDTGEIFQTHAFERLKKLDLHPQHYPVAWDRASLVFSAREVYSNNLWEMQFSERSPTSPGDLHVLTNGAEFEVIPWVSPGGYMTYAQWKLSLRIWRISLLPGHRTPELLTEEDARDLRPTVSRDGRFLLFARRFSDRQGTYLKDLRNRTESTVTDDERSSPVISPDGRSAILAQVTHGETRLWLRDLQSGNETAVCDNCGAPLSWLPDNNGVLFLVRSPAGNQIRALDLTSRNVRTVLSGQTFNGAVVSPDGKRIAYVAESGPNRNNIYIAPFGDKSAESVEAPFALTGDDCWEQKPQWSDNGREIFFSSNRDGFPCLWRQKLDANGKPAGAPEAMFHFHKTTFSPMHISHPMFNAAYASNHIYFNAAAISGNLWRLRR